MERRQGPDRRKHSRGGRRPSDQSGVAPLVLVIDADYRRREIAEAILAKLQFAVAPVGSVEQALSIVGELQPAAIVCRVRDTAALRAVVAPDLPIVNVADDMLAAETLIEALRAALSANDPVH
jgi:CheY-like chemotaxis protein